MGVLTAHRRGRIPPGAADGDEGERHKIDK